MIKKLKSSYFNSHSEYRSFYKTVFRLFFWSYTLLAILLTTLLFYIYQGYTKNLEQKMLAHEESFIASTAQSIKEEMRVQLMILQMSTKNREVANFIEQETQQNRKELETLFSSIGTTFYRYDQMRLIDIDGNEKIRINFKNNVAYTVKETALQNKKSRTYFQEGIKQSIGKVYVSPIELNMEYGKVEFPYKPVVRFATPISDSTGEKAGLLVINYLATELLQNFRDQMNLRIYGQGMLIDPQGYWISNHDRANEWGGSLQHVDQKFENLYPLAWQSVKNSKDGTLKTKNGIFRYVAIDPFSIKNESKYKAEQNIALSVDIMSRANSNWKLVIFLPNQTIQNNSFFHRIEGKVIIFTFFITLAIILLLLIILYEEKRRTDAYDLFVKNELDDLYENSPCGYHSLDKNGVVIKINKTELNWLGYHYDEVIGKSFKDFLTPESKLLFQTFLETLQIDKQVEGVVLEIQCKDGRTFFASTSATSIFEQGNFVIARTSSFNITDRIQLERRLDYIAHTDVLTEISNRRHFFSLAAELFESQNKIALMMIDIDHFKKINDQYGHDAGDLVLKKLASTITQLLPEDAIFARLGGEEFAVLLSSLDIDEAMLLAQQLCVNVEKTEMLINTNTTLNLTISIGLSQRSNMHDDINELLKRGDVALYEAKSTGRNKVV